MKNLDVNELLKDGRYVVSYVNKYLSERPEIIFDLFEQTGLNLLTAPTGVGKTISKILASVKYVKFNKNKIILLGTPNRSQSEQNAVKKVGISKYTNSKNDLDGFEIAQKDMQYNEIAEVVGVYAGVDLSAIDFSNISIVSVVYDRVAEVVELLGSKFKKEIIFVIDEAHELYKADDYREDAVRQLHQLVKNNKYIVNTIYMTATPDVLTISGDNKFNKVVKFNLNKPKYNADKLTVYRYNKSDYKNTLVRAVIERFEEAKKQNRKVNIVMRFNSVADADLFKNKILTEYDVAIINSSLKDDSAEYKSIVERESLTENDLIITTSLIDSGVSIQNHYELIWFFVSTHNELDIDNILQSFNRARNTYREAVLFIRDTINFSNKTLFERESKTIEFYNTIIKMVQEFHMDAEDIAKNLAAMKDDITKKEDSEMVNYVVFDKEYNVYIDNIKKANYLMHMEAAKCINFNGMLKKKLSNVAKDIEEIVITKDIEVENEQYIKNKIDINIREAKKELRTAENKIKKEICININEVFDNEILGYMNTLSKRQAKETFDSFRKIFTGDDVLSTHYRKHYFESFNNFYKALFNEDNCPKEYKDEYLQILSYYVETIADILKYYSSPLECLNVVIPKMKKGSLRTLATIRTKVQIIKTNNLLTATLNNKEKLVEQINKLKTNKELFVQQEIERYEGYITRYGINLIIDKEAIAESYDKKFKPDGDLSRFDKLEMSSDEFKFLLEFRKCFDKKIRATISEEYISDSIAHLNTFAKDDLTEQHILKLISRYYNVSTAKKTRRISSVKKQL